MLDSLDVPISSHVIRSMPNLPMHPVIYIQRGSSMHAEEMLSTRIPRKPNCSILPNSVCILPEWVVLRTKSLRTISEVKWRRWGSHLGPIRTIPVFHAVWIYLSIKVNLLGHMVPFFLCKMRVPLSFWPDPKATYPLTIPVVRYGPIHILPGIGVVTFEAPRMVR